MKLNNSPIYWLSKKQSGIETSLFGSKFMAMKYCCEYIRGLQYKLRMMCIFVNGPAYIVGDNKSVLSNESMPDSVLRKKSNSIAYHFIREGSAANEWHMSYIGTNDNIADMLTKPLGGGEKGRDFLVWFCIMLNGCGLGEYDIFYSELPTFFLSFFLSFQYLVFYDTFPGNIQYLFIYIRSNANQFVSNLIEGSE